ncbi:thiamine pyrophosphokinase 1 isoform X2 [Anabrus simplex]|uniref:thiamine pyrophosphokinase 1 isoform X2 n=1 Tax=Anabrus simplex TaxID=316456 RepID=UPI0035A33F0E
MTTVWIVRITHGETDSELASENEEEGEDISLPVTSDAATSHWHSQACVRITVDGGTNRWYEYAKSEEDCALPDMIIGDMDSATVEVLNYYQERDVNIIRTPDQNETDFTKALRKTASYARNRQLKLDAVIAVVQTSGRLDQIIGIVNTLHKADSILDGLPVFIFSGTSLTWLLAPGKHYIDLRKYKHLLGKWCSLMPLGKPAHHVTTTGLKWNLVDRVMEFGGMVSTSNAYGSELEITVQTDSSLVWCMSVGEDIDDT